MKLENNYQVRVSSISYAKRIGAGNFKGNTNSLNWTTLPELPLLFFFFVSSIQKIQKTQVKKIHSIQFTPEELKKELKKPNKAFIDAIKKGIILFGQEKFIKFMRTIHKNEY